MGGMPLYCRIDCLIFVPTVGISMQDPQVYPPQVVLLVSIHSTRCDTRYPLCGSRYDFWHLWVDPPYSCLYIPHALPHAYLSCSVYNAENLILVQLLKMACVLVLFSVRVRTLHTLVLVSFGTFIT
jgi:hypothetical protein